MICENCGKEFQNKTFNQKFCSYRCREKARAEKSKSEKVLRKCKNCGKEFSVNSSNELKKFCSKKCCNSFSHKMNPPPKKEKVLRICKTCGKEFYAGIHNYFYCSEECRNPKSVKKEAEIIECPVCHKKFKKKNYKNTYCSEECRKEMQYQRKKELNYVNVTCPTCGKTRRVLSSYKYEECFSCRHSIQKIKSKPTYSINQVVAIQQALDKRYNRYFGYPEVVDKLEKGDIIIDKLTTHSGFTTAEAHLKGE